jgi:hypothetical protein
MPFSVTKGLLAFTFLSGIGIGDICGGSIGESTGGGSMLLSIVGADGELVGFKGGAGALSGCTATGGAFPGISTVPVTFSGGRSCDTPTPIAIAPAATAAITPLEFSCFIALSGSTTKIMLNAGLKNLAALSSTSRSYQILTKLTGGSPEYIFTEVVGLEALENG